jgi:hypothetical protein
MILVELFIWRSDEVYDPPYRSFKGIIQYCLDSGRLTVNTSRRLRGSPLPSPALLAEFERDLVAADQRSAAGSVLT